MTGVGRELHELDSLRRCFLQNNITNDRNVTQSRLDHDRDSISIQNHETDEVTVPTSPSGLRQADSPKVQSMVMKKDESIQTVTTVPDGWQDVRYGRVELLAPWFPLLRPGDKSFRSRRSRRRGMLLTALGMSLTVLIANVVALLVLRKSYSTQRGVVPLYEGSCNLAKHLDVMVHVFINILSTMLLGASNLCMQLLVSPTRKEVDRAHSQRKWLDIGAPSLRNLSFVRYPRVMVWCCLSLTSLPIHFIYNSAISTSIPMYGYAFAVVQESFLNSAHFGNSYVDNTQCGSPSVNLTRGLDANHWPPFAIWNATAVLPDWQAQGRNSSRFSNITKDECLKIYTNVFAQRTNLMYVTQDDDTAANSSILQFAFVHAQFGSDQFCPCNNHNPPTDDPAIACSGPDLATQSLENWTKFGHKVLYCLVENSIETEHCRLNYSPPIFVAICILSTIKCICIALVSVWFREETLNTVGDAVASFLKDADNKTSHMGMIDKSTLYSPGSPAWDESAKMRVRSRKTPLYLSATKRRWITWFIASMLTVVSGAISVSTGFNGTKKRSRATFLWQLRQPLGLPDPSSFTGYFLPRYGTQGFIASVVWANLWQVVVSILYFFINALITTMLVAEEWNGYDKERKPLRVSHPQGLQRSTYFISIPFKFGIPLMAVITALHVLLSQSTFLVDTVTFWPVSTGGALTEDISSSFSTVGYSTAGSFAATVYGGCLVVIIAVFSLYRLPATTMPLVSTCSAAISAACHPPVEDVDAHLLPVQWGVIDQIEDVARCSFTTLRDVEPPCGDQEVIGMMNSNEPRISQIQRKRWQPSRMLGGLHRRVKWKGTIKVVNMVKSEEQEGIGAISHRKYQSLKTRT